MEIGQVLQNRYRIEAPLGRGGMGSVYRALDQSINIPCVIKELMFTAQTAKNPQEAREQFQREAMTLASLRHNGLPRVTHYFWENENYYLVMDLVEGQPLDRMIVPGGLPEADVVSYSMQLLEVLEYIHSRGVLHRDIKPANIIVQPDGQAILVDFGLVKVVQPGDMQATMNFLRGMGTPEYAPPEQYTGGTDQRSDLYSLGATMYQALTGQAMPTAMELMTDTKTLVDPRMLNPRISENTAKVVLRAVALKRDDRYASARSMRAALAQVATGDLPKTEYEKATSEISQPMPLGATMVMPGSSTVQPAGPGTVPAIVGAGQATPSGAFAPPAPARRTLPIAILGAVGALAVVVIGLIVWRPWATGAAPVLATSTPAVKPTRLQATVTLFVPPATETPASDPTTTETPIAEPTATKPPPPAVSLVLTLVQGVTMDFVNVPGGDFLMGASNNDKDAMDREKPQGTVNLDNFLIGKFEVTNAQFAAFTKATGYKTTAEKQGSGLVYVDGKWIDTPGADWQHPRGPDSNLQGKEKHPVVLVSWDDAVAFCAWVSKVTGRKVQLPTEAQWEKAARGTDGRLYPWGSDPLSIDRANYDAKVGDTTPVGQYGSKNYSPYGVADMAGNVWEWTSSLFKPYPYDAQDGREDQSSRDLRAIRGGSFLSPATQMRVTARNGLTGGNRNINLGFRVAVLPA